jgi:hypothetical protein
MATTKIGERHRRQISETSGFGSRIGQALPKYGAYESTKAIRFWIVTGWGAGLLRAAVFDRSEVACRMNAKLVTGTYPFGSSLKPLAQVDRSPKRLFVLGVYASAVHAQWIGPDGRLLVRALAVASEPVISSGMVLVPTTSLEPSPCLRRPAT